jgi:hypothetical protein
MKSLQDLNSDRVHLRKSLRNVRYAPIVLKNSPGRIIAKGRSAIELRPQD